MNRVIIRLIVAAVVVLLGIWIARNTYWDNVTIPSPLKNEAAHNPFYGAQHLVEQLGATSSWDRVLRDVSPDAVFLVSSWHWDLAEGRRTRIERWVEAGGRLVVDESLVDGTDAFKRWTGIGRISPPLRSRNKQDDDTTNLQSKLSKPCRVLHDATPSRPPGATWREKFELCSPQDGSHLATTRQVAWGLKDDFGYQVLRVNVGKGSVTAVNGVPFRFRQLLEGDNGALLIAAAQLRAKDDVHFLSEEDHPSMLALMWILGWPVVVLILALIALALWRNGVRFGPRVAQPDPARRSLAEQIRGTGQFILRVSSGRALHAAAVRALNEAAQRRIGAWWRLSASEQVDAVARLAGADPATLGPAMNPDSPRRPPELRQAIVVIESVRRRLLNEKKS